MLRIAVCDDEERCKDDIRAALSNIEESWKADFEDRYFSSGEELCEDLEENSYDVILLDILMDGIDGIETAKKIQLMDSGSYIIFISSYDKRWKELFGKRTLAFLDKPVNIPELNNELRKVVELLETDKNDVFTYKVNGVEKFLYSKEIIFFECVNQRIEIVTTKEVIAINDSLRNIWTRINHNVNFLMPSRSYILNLRHARMVNTSTFFIPCHSLEIKVGRTMKKDVSERYLRFIRRV